jgi:hypothetical protein
MDDEIGRKGVIRHIAPSGDIVTAIVCGTRSAPRRYCVACVSKSVRTPAPYLCDFPIAPGKTCDKAMCEEHRRVVAPGVDYCRDHPEKKGEDVR